jgi:hypothetical protein
MTRTQNRTANAVSLFPFLAVLVCAMGALIFLLIIITRRVRSDVVNHAREIQSVPVIAEEFPEPEKLPEIVTFFPPQPEHAAQLLPEPEPTAQKKPFVKIQPEPVDPDAALRIEIASLTSDRSNRQKTVADKQAELSKARRRLNETESKLARIERQWIETEEKLRENNKQTNSAVEKRRRLTERLKKTRQQIKRVRRQNTEAGSRYAFIPFDGVSGTTRRPILIECSGSGLRFVPEGISLTLDDLEGFTLEVNPLLAGVHSLAEYFSEKAWREQSEKQASQPYALLLVRPSGSVPYYAARKLLSNLSQPHGYELIEEDWELDLPEVDPEARRICKAAVEETEAKRKKTMKAFVIGRGTGPGGRMIRFHKETGSFEVVDSDSSFLSGNGPLSKNRNSGDAERSSTGTSQREPSIPRRKVIDVAGVPYDGDGKTSSFNRDRKGAGSVASLGSGTRNRRMGTGHVSNDDDIRSGQTVTGAESSFHKRNLPGKRPDGRFVSRNPSDGKTGSEARFGSVSENETGAAGRVGFRNDFEEQNRFPKPLSQALENGGVSRKDPLRNERLYKWTDTGIEQGKRRRPRQKWDSPTQDRSGTKTVIDNHRVSGSYRGVLADSKTNSHDTGRVLRQGANVRRRNGSSDRSLTAFGEESQLTTSDDVNVSLNSLGSRDRRRVANQTSGSSSSRGPAGSRPLSANQAGTLSVSSQLQRKRDKRTQSPKTTLRGRRWGKSGSDAGIGFEREVLIQVDAERLIVGRDYRIDFDSQNRNNPELLEQVLYGIEREARLWGTPPTSFYWVPRVRIQFGPGGSNTASELKDSLKQVGLFSRVEYVQKPTKPQQRPE